MRYITLLSTLPALVFATLSAATPDPAQEVRFSLQLIEKRCVESVAATPVCGQRLGQPERARETDTSPKITEKRVDYPGWQTLAAGSSGTLASCSPDAPAKRWDVTFREWQGDAAFVDFEYLRESGCDDDRSLDTRISTQTLIPIPGRQSLGSSILTAIEGNQRIVTKSEVVLIAAPEPMS